MSGYIGVNNVAKKIKRLYIGINGLAKKVKIGYIGIGDTAKVWYEDYPEGPNDQYKSASLGTWSSLSDVDNFFNTYTYKNGWQGLKLGNYVTIQDGTYNANWEIAGFNMEHNQTAADGTVYDNGYGICFIPIIKTSNMATYWDIGTIAFTKYGYNGSSLNTSLNDGVKSRLYDILGEHLINRNVLLSSGIERNTYYSSSYIWTTAYLTSMSVGQLKGEFASYKNQYDDGEANYKLPLFNYESYLTGTYWTRGIAGKKDSAYLAYIVASIGHVIQNNVTQILKLRPMMYLR